MAGAATEDVKVLGLRLSPFAIRVVIALRLKKVEHELVEVRIAEPKSEILAKSNPVHKKIPVLLHCGKPVCESAVIVQYIDEEWPGGCGGSFSILPADPFDRAFARFWAAYIDDTAKLIFLIKAFRAATEAAKATKLAAQIEQVLQMLEGAFAECSKGKEFFGGDTVGYLDIMAGSYLGWILALEKLKKVKFLDAEKVPRLTGWAARFLAEESVKAAMPEADEYVELVRAMAARRAASAR